jgi:hypothetical protein
VFHSHYTETSPFLQFPKHTGGAFQTEGELRCQALSNSRPKTAICHICFLSWDKCLAPKAQPLDTSGFFTII